MASSGPAVVALLSAFLMVNEVSLAQEPAAPAPPPWSTQCVSEARAVPPACTAEQTVLVRQQQNNQVLLTLRLQAPASRNPLIFSVQTPLGLLLPAGLTLQVDETPPLTLPLQTCDNAGCYAATPLNDELAKSYGSGTRLRIGLQTATREALTIELSLEGFAAALERIR